MISDCTPKMGDYYKSPTNDYFETGDLTADFVTKNTSFHHYSTSDPYGYVHVYIFLSIAMFQTYHFIIYICT